MAKKTTPSKKIAPISKKPVVSTPVRNTAIPKVKAVKTSGKMIEVTTEMISIRAYEIHASGNGGSETDNWFTAERELHAGI